MEATRTDLGDGVAIIRLVGKLNMVTAPELRDVVGTAVGDGQNRITVDLAKVDFLDSSGLGALINGLKATRAAGGDLRISGPNEQVKLVLRLTNLESLLTTVERAETAFTHG